MAPFTFRGTCPECRGTAAFTVTLDDTVQAFPHDTKETECPMAVCDGMIAYELVSIGGIRVPDPITGTTD